MTFEGQTSPDSSVAVNVSDFVVTDTEHRVAHFLLHVRKSSHTGVFLSAGHAGHLIAERCLQ